LRSRAADWRKRRGDHTRRAAERSTKLEDREAASNATSVIRPRIGSQQARRTRSAARTRY